MAEHGGHYSNNNECQTQRNVKRKETYGARMTHQRARCGHFSALLPQVSPHDAAAHGVVGGRVSGFCSTGCGGLSSHAGTADSANRPQLLT